MTALEIWRNTEPWQTCSEGVETACERLESDDVFGLFGRSRHARRAWLDASLGLLRLVALVWAHDPTPNECVWKLFELSFERGQSELHLNDLAVPQSVSFLPSAAYSQHDQIVL